MKTRLVELEGGGFVPQYWQKHFLFGGQWIGLYWYNGSLYGTTSTVHMIDKCSTNKKEAEKIIKEWTTRQLNKKKLSE